MFFFDFEQGFPVTLRINEEGENVHREEEGYFPPAPDIPDLYRNFQENYNNLESVQRAILVNPAQITNVSSPEECRQTARSLEVRLKEWFRHPSIAQLRVYVEEEVSKTESAHIIFQTNNKILKKYLGIYGSYLKIVARHGSRLVLGTLHLLNRFSC